MGEKPRYDGGKPHQKEPKPGVGNPHYSHSGETPTTSIFRVSRPDCHLRKKTYGGLTGGTEERAEVNVPWRAIFRKDFRPSKLGWKRQGEEWIVVAERPSWLKLFGDKHVITNWVVPGTLLFLTLAVAIALVLAGALAWGPHHCKPAFPMIIGCAFGTYESLSGGMIAAGSALIAGWLAWRAVQLQIDAEQRRADADRVEVEKVLQSDVDSFAEGLAAIWKILDGLEKAPERPDAMRTKLEGVVYGIKFITKATWLSTSRKMVETLGWSRRRDYEALFDGLEALTQFQDIDKFNVDDALNTVKRVSVDFEIVRPECQPYFEGLFRRSPKAWSLGDGIRHTAGIADH